MIIGVDDDDEMDIFEDSIVSLFGEVKFAHGSVKNLFPYDISNTEVKVKDNTLYLKLPDVNGGEGKNKHFCIKILKHCYFFFLSLFHWN